MMAYQKELRARWGSTSTAVAIAREFDTDIEVITAALYLPIDLDECGVPRSNPSIRSALEDISAEKIVITSSPSPYLAKAIQHLGLRECFTALIGCEMLPRG